MSRTADRAAEFDRAVAAAREVIENLDVQIWRFDNHKDGPDLRAIAVTEALKEIAVAEAHELLEARHAWQESLRERECRREGEPFMPASRHPSAEDLTVTLTGQRPASPAAVEHFREALKRLPFEFWSVSECEDWAA